MPIQAQVTIELTGRMLPGTEIGAALAAVDPLRPDIIGINCATGPAEMGEHLRYLCQHARIPVSCLPNAGLPSVVDGRMHYDLTPDQLADYHARFVTELRRHRDRRLLRHDAGVHPRPGRALRRPAAGRARRPLGGRAPPRSTRSPPSTRTPRS